MDNKRPELILYPARGGCPKRVEVSGSGFGKLTSLKKKKIIAEKRAIESWRPGHETLTNLISKFGGDKNLPTRKEWSRDTNWFRLGGGLCVEGKKNNKENAAGGPLPSLRCSI